MQVHLCGDEVVVIITLDTRTGKLNLRDTGDLAAAGHGYATFSDKVNENPTLLFDSLIRLRLIVSSSNFVAIHVFNVSRLFSTLQTRKQVISVCAVTVTGIWRKKVCCSVSIFHSFF